MIKSMVPFTPCICVCCGVKLMLAFTPVLLSVVGLIHGLIYTLYLWSNPWSHPVLEYSCLLWGQTHAPFTPCTFVCSGVKSMVWFTPCTCNQIYGPIYTLYLCLLWVKSMVWFTPLLLVIKSMVPFTPCTFVCCGVKSLVRFTPCTCVQIHDPIYTLCLCLLWGQMNDPRIYTLYVCLLCGQCIGPIYTLYWPRVESSSLTSCGQNH